MSIIPFVTRYYTIVISKTSGKAKAVCCQMQGHSSNKPRADAAARNCNFFHTLEEAKAVANEINELLTNRTRQSKED